jgi:hypothetical protein
MHKRHKILTSFILLPSQNDDVYYVSVAKKKSLFDTKTTLFVIYDTYRKVSLKTYL